MIFAPGRWITRKGLSLVGASWSPSGSTCSTTGSPSSSGPGDVEKKELAHPLGRALCGGCLSFRVHECTRGCVDKNDAVWDELDKLVFSPFRHANGNALRAKAISIDSGDGNTNDAVYSWVRTRSAKYPHVRVMAIKGASDRQDPEIFATPRLKSIDHHRPDKQTKADRHGVKVYIVGTDMSALRAKVERGGPLQGHRILGRSDT